MQLPEFRYHPDPIATGNVEASTTNCRSCGQARGYIYTGPVHAAEELDRALCPWCIADGSAANRFSAEFVDSDAIGDYGDWDQVPEDVVDEIAKRTPGFTGWQQERWWTHCGDGAEFLGSAGREELETKWPNAIPAIRAELGADEEHWDDYFASLDAEGSPTAYVFRCRHCGALGGYSDCD
jgi:uncharacterized protein CbrC (UPF0167 family)